MSLFQIVLLPFSHCSLAYSSFLVYIPKSGAHSIDNDINVSCTNPISQSNYVHEFITISGHSPYISSKYLQDEKTPIFGSSSSNETGNSPLPISPSNSNFYLSYLSFSSYPTIPSTIDLPLTSLHHTL